MSLQNFFTLTILVEDYNVVADRVDFMKELRRLTISYYSGLNTELNRFEVIRKERPVKCDILSAYRSDELVGWAILSKETSDFRFRRGIGYEPNQGYLFEVFVDHAYRRQGIGSELLRVARQKAGNEALCICPHDFISEGFYEKCKNTPIKLL
jgi:GNAT superfamily N-acetyltransferase